ncbi:MAG: hypothetical protein LBG91_01870 [Treponema sp.]|jgi:DNA repair exonuclease SbcCD ATPase subunit|nr:hypothetical protein [Treponema sp.]
MTNNSEIVFDSNSGIPVEEQEEILSRINGIAEKNRRQLQEGSGGKFSVSAKKKDGLFPVLVNVTALAVLSGGILFLLSLNGKKDVQIREGGRTYTALDRALIEEIRRETALELASKENEIALIYSQLEDVDARLNMLYSNNQSLTQEQLAAESQLLILQNVYRAALASSQEERSRILENSRSREARLRTMLEAETKELDTERNVIMAELDSLASDQERAAAIDSQLSGGIAAVYDLIQKGQFEQAGAMVRDLRFFLDTPAFLSIRSFQSRKEFYTQTINSLETMLDEIRLSSGGFSAVAMEKELTELRNKNSQLEETVAEMDKSAAAGSSGQTRRINDQARRITELENSLSAQRSANSTLEANAAARERTINSLESEKAALAQTSAEKDNTISAREREIANLNNQIKNIRQALQDLSQ